MIINLPGNAFDLSLRAHTRLTADDDMPLTGAGALAIRSTDLCWVWPRDDDDDNALSSGRSARSAERSSPSDMLE